MKNYSNSFALYVLLNIILYALIFTSASIVERDQKNSIADTITNLTREHFLITDYRSLFKDIEKSKSKNFNKIVTFDKNNKMITESQEDKNHVSLKITKSIWADEARTHSKGTIYFYYGIDHLFWISFQILLCSMLITFPLFIFTRRVVKKRQLELVENEKIKALAKLTKQISHDIRSPIAALQQISEATVSLTDNDQVILKNALQRINEIANKHLETSDKHYLEQPQMNDLEKIVIEIVNEKTAALRDIKFDLNIQPLSANFVPMDLKRILSNLINNSYEALSKKHSPIKITLKSVQQFNVLSIEDSGGGIPKDLINTIGKKEVTSKKNGNGLGFLHAIETLKIWNADLNIVKSDKNGTILEVLFPIEKPSFILIDDDELVRMTWKGRALKNDIKLITYDSFQEFNNDRKRISKNTAIYIDSDLGDSVSGEMIAEQLHKDGFTNISIASGFGIEKFKNLDFLKSIISKKPPF